MKRGLSILVKRVQACLSDDFRKSKYRGNSNPLAGHCYVASEALYHLLGGKDSGWKPMVMRIGGETHWFLLSRSGDLLDATASQFKELPAYSQATGCGFLTKKPSKRAQKLISKVIG